MPIPGDNGNPKAEKEAQEKRIDEVSEHGADVKQELKPMVDKMMREYERKDMKEDRKLMKNHVETMHKRYKEHR